METTPFFPSRRTALRRLGLVLVVASLLAVGGRANSRASLVLASEPPDRPAVQTEAASVLTSPALDCLTAADSRTVGDSRDAGIEYGFLGEPATSCSAAGTVTLHWQGQVERVRLVLSVGSIGTPPQATHTILINGQPAASVPSWTDPTARAGGLVDGPVYHRFEISPALVTQGDNVIEILDDALPGDRWTATDIRLHLYGQLELVADGNTAATQPGLPEPEAGSDTAGLPTTVTQRSIRFRNPSDGSWQDAMIQIPDGYNSSTATPLLLFAHGRTGVMEYGIDYLGAAANARGWLLASPEMHGSWDVPSECYVDPDSCTFDDRTLMTKPGAYAHASLESQYDIIGLAQYMNNNYNVDHSRIYLVGGSMGGQIATVTAGKFPHMFAAVYAYKSITNLTQWYGELNNHLDEMTLEKECHIGGTPKTPAENPFCYERRSSTYFARNYIHVPISMTHSIPDTLVPISHSRNLRDAINSFDPTIPSLLHEDRTAGWLCAPPYHCIEPAPTGILNYLAPFTLNSNPDHIRIASDESKTFYWMNLDQIGGDHWSYVDVTRDPDSHTVRVTTNDANAVRVGINLGTGRIGDYVVRQPGMGLPATTYLVKGAGYNNLVDYTSGYLTTQVNTRGQSTYTVSAIEVVVNADPATVPDDGTHVSAITILVQDQSDQANPVPNGTPVRLETTEGRFANGRQTISLTTVNGRAATTLTVNSSDDLAEITATVRQASGTATVDVLHTGITLDIIPADSSATAYANVPYNLRYRVTNHGDSTLNSIVVRSDNGSGGTVTICQGHTLAPQQSVTCNRSFLLTRNTTITARATGSDPAGGQVTASDSVQITVIAPRLRLTVSPNPLILQQGQPGTLVYEVSNTGDTTLTAVTITDDDGGGGNVTVCSVDVLPSDRATTCSRVIQLSQTATFETAKVDSTAYSIGESAIIVATATGTDPLNNEVRTQTQVTVAEGVHIYLPNVIRAY